MWFRAPHASAVLNHGTVRRVRHTEVNLLPYGQEDRICNGIKTTVKIEPPGLNTHFFRNFNRRARADHWISEGFRLKLVEQVLVNPA